MQPNNVDCYGNYELAFQVKVQFDYKNGGEKVNGLTAISAFPTVIQTGKTMEKICTLTGVMQQWSGRSYAKKLDA